MWDCGLRIADLERHRAWGIEHREMQLAEDRGLTVQGKRCKVQGPNISKFEIRNSKLLRLTTGLFDWRLQVEELRDVGLRIADCGFF